MHVGGLARPHGTPHVEEVVTVLEAAESKIGVLADSVLGESLFPACTRRLLAVSSQALSSVV